jgi:ABC-2 type transport system ATP-binding protein
MRADLAAAMIHSPRIVYLDEPTIGLDLAVKDRVRQFFRDMRDDGVTVMLTSHDLADIEGVCRRLIIIDDGRVIFDGDLQTVMDEYARDRTLTVATETAVDLDRLRADLPAARIAEGETPLSAAVTFDRFALTAGQVVAAVSRSANPTDFRIDEPSIEDVIRRVYSRDLRLPDVAPVAEGG